LARMLTLPPSLPTDELDTSAKEHDTSVFKAPLRTADQTSMPP